MRNYLQTADYLLWGLIIVGQWALLIMAIKCSLQRQMPRYLAFLSFVSLQSPTLLAISRWMPYNAYFWAFYVGMTIETFLLLMVVYDIFKTTFAPLTSLPVTLLPRMARMTTVLAATAVSLTLWIPGITGLSVFALARNYHRTAQLIICALLWCVVLYARHVGIPWRSRSAWIAGGFLVYLSTQAIVTGSVTFTRNAQMVMWLSRIGLAGYLAGLAFWGRALTRAEERGELPTPEALLVLRREVAMLRLRTKALTVREPRSRWIEE